MCRASVDVGPGPGWWMWAPGQVGVCVCGGVGHTLQAEKTKWRRMYHFPSTFIFWLEYGRVVFANDGVR